MRLAPLVCFIAGCAPSSPSSRPDLSTGASSSPFTTSPEPTEPPAAAVPSMAVPLVGGTLAVNASWAAASDPESGRVVFASRSEAGANVAVELGIDSAPAQVAWVGAEQDQLAVLLRGTGSLALFDAHPGTVPTLAATVPVCAAPAGLAWDAARLRTWVVCASGELVGLNGAVVELSRVLELDLNDIVILPSGKAFVSQLHAATVLTVDLETATVLRREVPRGDSVIDSNGGVTHFAARVLRRLVADGQGGAVALYQMHQDGPIDLPDPDEPEPEPEEATYGLGSSAECGGVVRTGLATLTEGAVFGTPTEVQGTSGVAVDVAMDRWGTVSAIAASGAVLPWSSSASCRPAGFAQIGPGLPTSVVEAEGEVFVVARDPFFLGTLTAYTDPALLALHDVSLGDVKTHSGLALFHAAPQGVACASCHPEGTEDGHVWAFDTGARKTQSLAGLVPSETPPYHWNGDLATFDDLFHDVGQLRMGLPDADAGLLLDFLDRLPRPPSAAVVTDVAAAARGAELFVDPTVGCADCHNGWRYSDDGSADVGTGGLFQVPSLIGVGTRAPLMHDGCADTLDERFTDPYCGGGDLHGVTSHLQDEDIDALVAYLRTL